MDTLVRDLHCHAEAVAVAASCKVSSEVLVPCVARLVLASVVDPSSVVDL